MRSRFIYAVLVFWLAPTLGSAQMKGDPKAGKAKYDANCIGCHGATGKGDGAAAAALNPKPQDHTDGKTMNALKEISNHAGQQQEIDRPRNMGRRCLHS